MLIICCITRRGGWFSTLPVRFQFQFGFQNSVLAQSRGQYLDETGFELVRSDGLCSIE